MFSKHCPKKLKKISYWGKIFVSNIIDKDFASEICEELQNNKQHFKICYFFQTECKLQGCSL